MTAFSDETGELLAETKRIIACGVTDFPVYQAIALLEKFEAALSASPVAQEPVAWVEFTEAGLIRFWTSDPARAEIERTKRSLTKFSLSELIALVGRPRTPPATPAGVGADEIARVIDDAINKYGSLMFIQEHGWSGFCAKVREHALALLSRAGDQK